MSVFGLLPTEKNLRYHQNFKTSSMSVAVKTGIYSACEEVL